MGGGIHEEIIRTVYLIRFWKKDIFNATRSRIFLFAAIYFSIKKIQRFFYFFTFLSVKLSASARILQSCLPSTFGRDTVEPNGWCERENKLPWDPCVCEAGPSGGKSPWLRSKWAWKKKIKFLVKIGNEKPGVRRWWGCVCEAGKVSKIDSPVIAACACWGRDWELRPINVHNCRWRKNFYFHWLNY